MNTTDYLREGYRQLQDDKFCVQIPQDKTLEVEQKITGVLTAMRQKGLITDKNLEHLSPNNTKEVQFYLLPKIHKKGVPGRPICSSVNHPTTNISKFVDAHIKDYVPRTNSYIRDTQDFIGKLKQLGPVPSGAILATFDVTSLYTNIPNNEGINAVADKMRADPTKLPIYNYKLDLLKLVLHNMYFDFNGEHYLQIGGTAMGTALAPNYANLFMDKFETKALSNYHLKPLIWKRFIDDIFLIWTHGEAELLKFVDYMNNQHQTIKFTQEFSYNHINFLDTTVKFGLDRKLITTLYNKPTDTHLYLHYNSAHPHSVTHKGPFGQFLRLRRICSLDQDYLENAEKLISYYKKRGYPANKIIKHHKKALKYSQDELLDTVNKSKTDKPALSNNLQSK